MRFRTAISLGLLAAAVLTGCTQQDPTTTPTSSSSTTIMPTTSTTTSSLPASTTTVRPVVAETPTVPPTSARRPATTTIGDLPPTWICQRESRCTYGIVSNGGCSGWNCYGKWQFDPTTWRAVVHRYGLTDIPDWPPTDWARVTPAMEDAVAAALWAGGRGCAHWAACR